MGKILSLKKGTQKRIFLFCILSLFIFSLSIQYASPDISQNAVAGTSIGTATEVTGALNPVHENFERTADASVFSPNEEIWVIVQMAEDSLAKAYTQTSYGSIRDFANSNTGITLNNSLTGGQNRLKEKLSRSFDIKFRDSYTAALNGFSAQIKYRDLEKLKQFDGVESVIVSEVYAEPKTETVTNPVQVFETGIYDASDVAYDGSGMLVGVLDTGFDYTHSAFQTMPAPETLSLTKDKVSNLLGEMSISAVDPYLRVNDVYLNDKIPFAYNYADWIPEVYSENAHGTHVAGIIAGQDDSKVFGNEETFSGVAPGAQLAIFKVFSSKENVGARQTDILAALDDAVLLGVDVLNLSLGATNGFSTEEDDVYTKIVYQNLREAGISVIVSAGNEGSSAQGSEKGSTNLVTNPDSGTIGSPGSYEPVFTVASIDGVLSDYFVANGNITGYVNDGTDVLGKKIPFAPQLLGNATTKEFTYVTVPGLGAAVNYNAVNVEGKIALVKRGTYNFEDKIRYARNNKAIAVIIYNNVSGTISMSIGKENIIPSCSILQDIGEQMAKVPEGKIVFSTSYKAGPFISHFSSWGVNPDMDIKPEITAHGGNIVSAVPGSEGYAAMSGTSMSAPNLAGAATILRQVLKERNPNASPKEISTLLNRVFMSTATIARDEHGNPYSPRKQGAGLASLSGAVNTDAYLYVKGTDKTKLSIGDDKQKTGVYDITFNVKNLSSLAKTFRISTDTLTESVSADGKNVTEKAYMLNGGAVSVSSSDTYVNGRLVTVGGFSDAAVSVRVTLTAEEKTYLDDKFANGMYVEGFVRLTPLNSGLAAPSDAIELSIPWLAFYGDWTKAPLFDVTAYEVAESAQDNSVLDEDKLKPDIFGSLPFGGFSAGTKANGEPNTGYWGLGQYAYNLGNEYTEPLASEDKAAISQNPNGTFEVSFVGLGTLRGAKEADIKITDDITGEVIFSNSQKNIRKTVGGSLAYPGNLKVGLNALDADLANNRKYNIYVDGRLDYGDGGTNTNLNNTFKSSFYVDSEAPKLLTEQMELRIVENAGRKRYYLDLPIYDNHYTQAAYLCGYENIAEGSLQGMINMQTTLRPIDSRRNVVTKVTYELTSFWNEIQSKGNKLYFEVYDYARNYSYWLIDLPKKAANTMSFKSNTTQKNMFVGQTADLKQDLVLSPADAWVNGVKWTSSDTTVASVTSGKTIDGVTVDETTVITQGGNTIKIPPGTVTAKAEGTAVITATTTDSAGNTLTASVTVNVTQNDDYAAKLESISLDKTGIIAQQGDTGTITASVTPYTLSDSADLTWTSSDPSRLIVEKNPDSNLKATYKVLDESAGSVYITVTDSTKLISATCEFHIREMFTIEGAMLTRYTGKGGVIKDKNGNITEDGVVTIPADKFLVYIGSAAFKNNSNIKKVIIPEGVTTIQTEAFANCTALTEVVLPSTLKTIEAGAFEKCYNLEKINLDKVEVIGVCAFLGSSLKAVNLSSAYFIGDYAFSHAYFYDPRDESESATAFTEADLSNAKYIGDYAFAGNKGLYNVTTRATTIGIGAFRECSSLKEINFTAKVSISDLAFWRCIELRAINFYAGASKIGISAFKDCISLTEITIPRGIEVIGDEAFAGCAQLTSIIIAAGADIDFFGVKAFGNGSEEDSKLTQIKLQAGNTSFLVDDGVLYDISGTKLVLYPAAKEPAGGIFNVRAGVTTIGAYAFSGATKIKRVNLNDVEVIEEAAFSFCPILEYVEFRSSPSVPAKLTYLGNYAFYSCSKLDISNFTYSSVENLEYMGDAVFYESGGAVSGGIRISLPQKISHIGQFAFAYMSELREIDMSLAENITHFSTALFNYCTKLTSVRFYTLGAAGKGVQTFGESVFAECHLLKSITLPTTVKELGTYMFFRCLELTTVTIQSGITVIPEAAFGRTAIVAFNMPSSVKVIEAAAFYESASLESFTGSGLNNITQIGTCAFVDTKLTQLIAPNVIRVERMLFTDYDEDGNLYENTILTKVSMPKLEEIGAQAFMNCFNLATVEIPKIKSVGMGAFTDCKKLAVLEMPSVEIIGPQAFSGTIIENIALPSSISKIYERAFYNMTSLKTITASQNDNYFVMDGVLYSKLPSGGYQLEKYPKNKTGDKYTVLEGTKRIASNAFEENKHLTEVTLSRALRTIGDSAFYKTNIQKYIFNSPVMPSLESYIAVDEVLEILYVPYLNFTEEMNAASGLTISRPSNGVGYDSYVLSVWFDSVTVTGVTQTYETDAIIDMLNALPAEVTLANEEAIRNARVAYDSLMDNQKQFVDNTTLGKLIEAERLLNVLLTQQEIDSIIAGINDLPSKITKADKDAVTALLERYNSLSEADKALITNSNILTAAAQKLEKLEKSNIGLILLITLGSLVLIAGAAAGFVIYKKKGGQKK